jgi:hypothetical protein
MPLPGVEPRDSAQAAKWNCSPDVREFLKNPVELVWDISSIPELSHIYQKKFSIRFDYWDNHACGW